MAVLESICLLAAVLADIFVLPTLTEFRKSIPYLSFLITMRVTAGIARHRYWTIGHKRVLPLPVATLARSLLKPSLLEVPLQFAYLPWHLA